MTRMRCFLDDLARLSRSRICKNAGWPTITRILANAATMLVLLATVLSVPWGYAQESKPESASQKVTAPLDVLPGLPRPPDAPASLFQKPVSPAYSCEPLPGPYFEVDPLLDPPELPPVGWFAGLDLGIIGPHIKNRLSDTAQIDGLPPSIVHLPTAPLDWTVAPRVELGYRLASGFGGFAFAYRFFGTDGSETVLGLDGPADLRSRLDINVVDFDYQACLRNRAPGKCHWHALFQSGAGNETRGSGRHDHDVSGGDG